MVKVNRPIGRLFAAVVVTVCAHVCFGGGGNNASVNLPCVCSGFLPKTSVSRTGVKIWDVSGFSSSGTCRNLVVCYGDSIYSETINRHRIDNKVVGDSIKIIAIKSSMARIDYIDCQAFPVNDFNTMCSNFTGRIVYFGDNTGSVSGSVTRNSDCDGLFVGFEGDTICGVSCTTDVFDLVLHFDVTEDAVRIERSRWFEAKAKLPFAVSERVCSRDSVDRYVESSVTFSMVASDELRRNRDNQDSKPVNDENILRMLDSIVVNGSGDVLNINGVLVDNHVLNVDIVDASGMHFGVKKFESLPATMSLSGLLPGNYMVVLSVTARPELTVKRMFVRR